MEIDIDKIPLFLRRINGWAGFIVEEGTKKPISIIDNKGVGANDFNRLVDFETAAQAVKDGRFDAIGVSLANQKITCIDLDCHSEENRERYKWVSKEILEQFKNTYAETSISGLGTHIFVQAEKPGGYKHSDAYGVVEIYNCVRFIVVTGWQLEDHVTYIGICQDELNSVCEKYLLKQETFTDTVGQGQYSKSDKEVVEKIEKFRKGKLFLEGRWDEVMKWDQNAGVEIKAFPSQSEADFGFAGLILYVNGNNPEQAIRIIKSSGMWDKKRASKKSSDYLRTTVEKASLRCNRVYDWNRTEYTPTEQTIDFDEVMLTYVDNQLVAQARENILCLTTNKELNSYLCKYVDNFGTRKKPVIRTTHGDFDSAANGVRFFLINQYNLVYLPEGDEWLAWNGKYWDRCYDKHLLSYAENVFYHLKHEAYNIFRDSVLAVDMKKDIEDEALDLFKYASTKKGKKECLEMVDFSKSRFVQSQKEQKIFDIVNANLNVLNLQNGVFNLDDMKFYPHERGYFQTKIAGVEYVPDAECPLWCDFLEMVLPNEPIRRYLQKAIGYTISSDCNQKCMFVLYGQNGNNGKTTITKTLYIITTGQAYNQSLCEFADRHITLEEICEVKDAHRKLDDTANQVWKRFESYVTNQVTQYPTTNDYNHYGFDYNLDTQSKYHKIMKYEWAAIIKEFYDAGKVFFYNYWYGKDCYVGMAPTSQKETMVSHGILRENNIIATYNIDKVIGDLYSKALR